MLVSDVVGIALAEVELAEVMWLRIRERPMQMLVPTLLVEKNMLAWLVVQVLRQAEEAPKPSILWYTLVQFTVQVCALPGITETMNPAEASAPRTTILTPRFIFSHFYDATV